jgi:hypothetical protein
MKPFDPEVLSKFCGELGRLIDKAAGTPEALEPWYTWAKQMERALITRTVQLRAPALARRVAMKEVARG